jgi:hypothetical protein
MIMGRPPNWVSSIALCSVCIPAIACGDDGMPMEMGTSSTGEVDPSSSSSSTGEADETSSSSSDGASSSSTGVEYPPAVGWGDCANIPAEFACLPDEVCVEYGTGSVCMLLGCMSSFDCPAEIGTGSAPVVCGDVAPSEDGLECYYLCSGMQTCPDGMSCDGDVCVWAGPASGSSGG